MLKYRNQSTETKVRKQKYGSEKEKPPINVLPTHDCALLSKGDCL